MNESQTAEWKGRLRERERVLAIVNWEIEQWRKRSWALEAASRIKRKVEDGGHQNTDGSYSPAGDNK